MKKAKISKILKKILPLIVLLCLTIHIFGGNIGTPIELNRDSENRSPEYQVTNIYKNFSQKMDSLIRGYSSAVHQDQSIITFNNVYLIDEKTSSLLENVYLSFEKEAKVYKNQKNIEAKAHLYWPGLGLLSIIGLLLCISITGKNAHWLISMFALLLIASVMLTGIHLSSILMVINNIEPSVLQLLFK